MMFDWLWNYIYYLAKYRVMNLGLGKRVQVFLYFAGIGVFLIAHLECWNCTQMLIYIYIWVYNHLKILSDITRCYQDMLVADPNFERSSRNLAVFTGESGDGQENPREFMAETIVQQDPNYPLVN